MAIAKPVTLSREEMLLHLGNNKTVLVSPKFEIDKDGQFVQTEAGKHVTSVSDLPSPLDLALGDPAKLAKAKADAKAASEAALADLAAIENAEAKVKADAEKASAGATTEPEPKVKKGS